MKNFPLFYSYEEIKLFPDLPKTVPYEAIRDHEKQALHNHDQTFERLAERGGLGPDELYYIMHDQPFKFRSEEAISMKDAIEFVKHLGK